MTPKVTIAIPAYKTQYLDVAIRSALNQTYDNIEIIVVDDCSPHDVKSVVESIADDRVAYIRNAENLGSSDPSLNWNECLRHADGEFLCLLCDDDVYAPTYVEEMVALAARYPDADIFRSGVNIIDGMQNIVGLFPLAPERESIAEYIWHLHSGNNRQSISEWMLRVSALHDLGGYVNAPKAWGSDAMTIFCLGRKSDVVTSPQRLVSFRLSDINITGMEHSYIAEKVEGWYRQCALAADIITATDIEYRDVVIAEIWRDHKNWSRRLLKHATLKDLMHLYGTRSLYRLKGKWFAKPFLYGALRTLHG